jgi:hypothetical protein
LRGNKVISDVKEDIISLAEFRLLFPFNIETTLKIDKGFNEVEAVDEEESISFGKWDLIRLLAFARWKADSTIFILFFVKSDKFLSSTFS